ncbi:hypothetical protein LPJ66_005519 [Kickxella alabastrina]|uniref:Uncharacterized protein n=1 Tax=Kickxella alabastrina TaxID=61397 RepID=A0ACC1IIA4_9FUNG|nr:hypothetical protein LPJ66_005519 [Kickxella alabastrina]
MSTAAAATTDTNSIDGRFVMTLTPTSSVAVLGLANMRYEQEPPGVPSNAGFPPQPQYSTQSITSHSAINNSNSPVTPAIGFGNPNGLYYDNGSPRFSQQQQQQQRSGFADASRSVNMMLEVEMRQQNQSGQQSLNGLANHPIGRYLSLLELQKHGRLQGNGEVGARSPLGLPLGAVPSALPAPYSPSNFSFCCLFVSRIFIYSHTR